MRRKFKLGSKGHKAWIKEQVKKQSANEAKLVAWRASNGFVENFNGPGSGKMAKGFE